MTDGRTRAVTIGYAALAVVNLIAVTTGSGLAEWLTKPLLMPVLIGLVIVAGGLRRPTGRLMVFALAAACVADVALLIPGDIAFLAGMLLFGVMQLLYLRTFWRLGAAGSVNRTVAVVLVVLVIGYLVVMWPKLGPLAPPMLVYGLLLTGMAILGSGLGRPVAVGGIAFLFSDLTIGLGVGGYDYPLRDLVVMATYSAAQFLIVWGWLAAMRRTRTGQPIEKSNTASVPPPSRLRSSISPRSSPVTRVRTIWRPSRWVASIRKFSGRPRPRSTTWIRR